MAHLCISGIFEELVFFMDQVANTRGLGLNFIFKWYKGATGMDRW